MNMKPADRIYLQKVVDDFIFAAINRASLSGGMVYLFRLGVDELKGATDRQRLHETVVADVISFFSGAQIAASYDQDRATFDISLDLSQCTLNQAQSAGLSAAMENFRCENG
jgi:hypothetical protein